MNAIREQTEVQELGLLSVNACLSRDSRGRSRKEEKCPIRTDFQRDRDRVIHSNAFRRLKGKTQVFLAPEGDHFRTRLTHTLEVSQIARTISRALRLNEDLTEAIALAHDLGHTPFGHAGEEIMSELAGGFEHYLQSVRVVHYIEKDGAGLNLTYEVKNGIAAHSGGTPDAATREGCIVCLSDKIAYINHDIEDSIRAGILTEQDIPAELTDILGTNKSERITSMVTAIIENGSDEIVMTPRVKTAHDALRRFMYDNVYFSPKAEEQKKKAKRLVEELYNYFFKHPEKIGESFQHIIESKGKKQAVIDYISSMTDHYAIHCFEDIFVPKAFV
ncbi:MAG: deoxyguanosinetriphosphate triphosphohydrolase [Ruminococcus sp.]|jgi:dGTPase|nr:deoxyguanosinetriphosphate triphosphohydrolase [Ruminococcus sp.]